MLISYFKSSKRYRPPLSPQTCRVCLSRLDFQPNEFRLSLISIASLTSIDKRSSLGLPWGQPCSDGRLDLRCIWGVFGYVG